MTNVIEFPDRRPTPEWLEQSDAIMADFTD